MAMQAQNQAKGPKKKVSKYEEPSDDIKAFAVDYGEEESKEQGEVEENDDDFW